MDIWASPVICAHYRNASKRRGIGMVISQFAMLSTNENKANASKRFSLKVLTFISALDK